MLEGVAHHLLRHAHAPADGDTVVTVELRLAFQVQRLGHMQYRAASQEMQRPLTFDRETLEGTVWIWPVGELAPGQAAPWLPLGALKEERQEPVGQGAISQ